MATAALAERGWYLKDDSVKELSVGGDQNVGKLVQALKDIDLKEVGKGWLPEEINRGRCEYVQGPGVLQIQKIRNVAAPKDNEESQYAPRLLKLTMTDGQNMCNGVEVEKLDNIGLSTPPGTKIYLKGTVGVEHGFLMLNNKNSSIIGGRVEKLAENWELKKMLSKQTRAVVGSQGGPPPFVPFGQRVRENKPQSSNKKEDFKSLDTGKEKKTEDVEFEQQRQATIAEALQAKEEGKVKSFGGGQKQVGSDADIARIVVMGFTPADANRALKQSSGDVQQAINSLLSGGPQGGYDRGGGRDRGGPPGRDRFQRNGPQGRDDRREKGGRGRQRDNDENDYMEAAPDTKPSGPATLFDFLETKIKPTKEEKGKSVQSQKPLHSSNSYENYNRSDSEKSYQDNRSQSQSNAPRFNRSESSRSNREKPAATQRSESSKSGQSSRSDQSQRQNSYENERSRINYGGNKGQRSNYSNRNGNYDEYSDNTSESGRRYDGKGQGQRSNYNQRDQRPQSARENYGNDRRDNYRNNDGERSRDNTYNNRQNDQRRENQRPRSSQDAWIDSRGNNSQSRDRRNDADFKDSRTAMRGDSSAIRGFNPRASDFVPAGQMGGGLQGFDPSQPPPPFNQPPPPMQQQQYMYSGQYQQQSMTNSSNTQQGAPLQWRRGDKCLAKYWEDNRFYEAVVEGVDPALPTCIVLFVDYGNLEEVKLTDVKPMSKQRQSNANRRGEESYSNYGNQSLPQQAYAAPVPMDSQVAEQQIRSMEFRRKRQDQPPQDDRPRKNTQQYYQPPRQRPQ